MQNTCKRMKNYCEKFLRQNNLSGIIFIEIRATLFDANQMMVLKLVF